MVHPGCWVFLFDYLILHQCYESVLTTFYPCGSHCILLPVAVETIFGDINVLSVYVHFKSDACFILRRHLLTSKIPALVMARTQYIHNSEIPVSEFRGHHAFGHGAMCDTPDSPELTYIWHDEHSFVEPGHVITTMCFFGNSCYLVTFSSWRTPLLFPFKLQMLFFVFF